jgi:hypothetical protein
MKKAGCRWVGAAATAVSHRICIRRKVSSGASPSSVGLEEGAFGASSVATRLGHVVGPLDAFAAIVLAIGSISAMRAFLQHVLALWTLMLILRMLVLLVSGATLCPFSLVVPRCLGVGLTSCATHLCLMWCRQDPLLGDARSSMSMAVWTLSFSPRLP